MRKPRRVPVLYVTIAGILTRHLTYLKFSIRSRLSAVENLTLEHVVHDRSSEEHNEVDRTEWHNLLRSFSKVKTLRIDYGLVGDLSRCLQLDGGKPPLELLPKLRALTISGSGDADNAFTSFINTRQNAGQPVILARS